MKPFSLPKAFQSLSDEQLTELNEWMDDSKSTYDIIRERLLEKYGIKVSNPTLTRYSQRRVMADEAIDHSDSAKNIRTFIALQNAEPVPYNEAGLAMIQKRAFEAACAPKISVGNLATLQRVFNYKTARADIEHKKQIAERNTGVREAKLALDREKLQNGRGAERVSARVNISSGVFHPRSTSIPLVPKAPTASLPSAVPDLDSLSTNVKNSSADSALSALASDSVPCDHLGPLARNWDDIRARAQKKFGITPEESARRAELRRTWKNPNSEDVSNSKSKTQNSELVKALNIVDFLKDLAADFDSEARQNHGRGAFPRPTSISRETAPNTESIPAEQSHPEDPSSLPSLPSETKNPNPQNAVNPVELPGLGTQSDHDSRSEQPTSGTEPVAGVGRQIRDQKSEMSPRDPNPDHPVDPFKGCPCDHDGPTPSATALLNCS